MKIGILGGAFNPPHLGHQLICRQTLDFTDIKEIWLTPCYKHTFDKNMASTKHRTEMAKMMLTNSKIKPARGGLKHCYEEIKNKFSGDSIILMDFLKQKYSRHEFSFIIGSDNLKTFKKWGYWRKLIKKYQFYIFPRPRFGFNLAKYGLDKKEYKFKLIKHPLLIHSNISSTNIRKRIKQELSITNLVPQTIKKYIGKNKLYE